MSDTDEKTTPATPTESPTAVDREFTVVERSQAQLVFRRFVAHRGRWSASSCSCC